VFRSNIALVATAILIAAPTKLLAAPAGHAAVLPWGVELAYIDKTVKPGDDFFLYANGNWVKHDVIPADRTYSGVNLELDKENEARLKGLVAELAASPDSKLTAEGRKLRDLYSAFMDTKQIEANGLKPAEKDLAKIAGLKSLSDVARAIGDPSLGLDGPFSLSFGVDDKNSDIYSVNLGQSGLGMPDRDYYLKSDKEIVATRAAYKKYLEQMLAIAGVKDAGARAEKVYALELAIAKVSWPAADRRDADKIYNPMTFPQLRQLAAGYDWNAMFAAEGVSPTSPKGDRKVVVAEKSAFPSLAKVFAATPIEVWRIHRDGVDLVNGEHAEMTLPGNEFLKQGRAQSNRVVVGEHLSVSAQGEQGLTAGEPKGLHDDGTTHRVVELADGVGILRYDCARHREPGSDCGVQLDQLVLGALSGLGMA